MKLIVLLAVFHSLAIGAFERRVVGARQAALGGSAAALGADPWCMLLNPGAAAAGPDRAAAFSVAPAVFGMPELTAVSALALVQTRAGAFGVSAERFGSGIYRELTASVTWSRAFAGVHAGVALSLHNIGVSGYGGASAFGVAAGILGRLTREITVGAAARNLNAPRMGASAEPLPHDFRAAVAYEPAPALSITADYVKQSGFTPAAILGCEARIAEACSVRLGFSDLPAVSSAGVGLRSGIVRVDYAVTLHADLGVSHVATLSLVWSR